VRKENLEFHIDAIKEFVYRVPKQAIEIAKYLIGNPIETKLVKIPGFDSSHYGKSYADVVSSIIEMLDRIRYIDADGVLPIIAELIRGENQEFKNKATEVLKHFSKYDLNVLKSKIGYGAQRKALDYILALPLDERLKNLDFIVTVAQEVLSSLVEGTSNGLNEQAQYTLTLTSGVVQPTPFLKKVRRNAIDLASSLYQETTDEQQKIKLAKAIEEAARGPMHVVYGDDVKQMIAEDAAYLIEIYRKMLFDENNKLVGSIAVAEEIETRLYWFHKNEKVNTPASQKLRADILADPFYSLFRLLAGDDVTFREEEGWNDAEKRRSDAMDARIESIEKENLEEWIENFDRISAQAGPVAEWQFHNFKNFLRRFVAKKPELAASVLFIALKNGSPLKKFAVGIFEGLRDVKRLDLWDRGVEIAPLTKDPVVIAAVLYSLNIEKNVDLKEEIRDKDLTILEDVVHRAKQFGFLGMVEKNITLEHATLNALTRNFQRDKKLIERLILETLNKYPEWRHFQLRELEFGAVRGWVDYSEFSPEAIDLLKGFLIDVSDLDWESQNFLLHLGIKDVAVILDVFWQRIEKDAKNKKGGVPGTGEHYRAIPYDINNELTKHISEQPNFEKYLTPWLDRLTPRWSAYNWNISHFLQQLGGGTLDRIVRSMVTNGGDENLACAVQLMDRFHGYPDIALCMEIVGKTKNKDILASIDGILHATGLVSGEDGLARAYEEKAISISSYCSSENAEIKKYAQRIFEVFTKSAERERKDLEEEKRLRQIEFEE
jgi:hypothetical protein